MTESQLIDRVRLAYKDRRRKTHVPEWGVDLYFGPVTFADHDTVEERKPKTPIDRALHMLVLKARTEDDKPAFQLGDVAVLKREGDIGVLNRLFEFMAAGALSTESAEKELKTVPFSGSSSDSPES